MVKPSSAFPNVVGLNKVVSYRMNMLEVRCGATTVASQPKSKDKTKQSVKLETLLNLHG